MGMRGRACKSEAAKEWKRVRLVLEEEGYQRIKGIIVMV